jgi:hypothetical protein
MMLRAPRAVAVIALSAAVIAAAACNDIGAGTKRAAIVEDIPWAEPESYSYILANDEQEEQARGTISVIRDGDDLVLRQYFFDDAGNTDEALLTVHDETLFPIAGRRTILDEDDDRRSVVDTQYETLSDGDEGVCIKQSVYIPPSEDEPDSTRSNPLKVPENAYDNDASLFLWRTIPFEEGYEETYTAIIANRRNRRPVTLRVLDQDRVQTPAGEFDAWKVSIEAEGLSQEAWFATTPDHKLLVYDNDDVIFLYNGETDVEEFDAPRPVEPSACE